VAPKLRLKNRVQMISYMRPAAPERKKQRKIILFFIIRNKITKYHPRNNKNLLSAEIRMRTLGPFFPVGASLSGF